MFQLDDSFLKSVGFDVSSMSEEKKAKYRQEFTAELNELATERLMAELDDAQTDEFSGIQEDAGRARQWLGEFHHDYQQNDEYKQLAEAAPNEDEAVKFYASALWMNHAVPRYDELFQKVLTEYHAKLVRMRQAANNSVYS